MPDPIQRRGITTHTTPRYSIGPQGKRQGGRQHTDGESVTQPPFIRHATHHHNGPTHHHCEGGADRGYPTTRTPQTHTHHPHCSTWQGTVHDMTAVLASTAVGRVGHEPHHCTGQDGSSTPTASPHTEEDGHHPPIHSSTLTLFTFTHSTINDDQ